MSDSPGSARDVLRRAWIEMDTSAG
jgi:hypothetical protein